MWNVVYLPEAENERKPLPAKEKVALSNADDKLRALGPLVPYPHSSAVNGVTGLRELRPRGGRSPWRAFYRQTGDREITVAAVGPEADHDKRRFDQAVRRAIERLDTKEEQR